MRLINLELKANTVSLWPLYIHEVKRVRKAIQACGTLLEHYASTDCFSFLINCSDRIGEEREEGKEEEKAEERFVRKMKVARVDVGR